MVSDTAENSVSVELADQSAHSNPVATVISLEPGSDPNASSCIILSKVVLKLVLKSYLNLILMLLCLSVDRFIALKVINLRHGYLQCDNVINCCCHVVMYWGVQWPAAVSSLVAWSATCLVVLLSLHHLSSLFLLLGMCQDWKLGHPDTCLNFEVTLYDGIAVTLSHCSGGRLSSHCCQWLPGTGLLSHWLTPYWILVK